MYICIYNVYNTHIYNIYICMYNVCIYNTYVYTYSEESYFLSTATAGIKNSLFTATLDLHMT